ncbi:hypothetical protein Alches_06600 [Alicyclobacillus hesperidum subsp. aegles]|uniref:YlzJ-like family protein n=1 Tax=Alicyclobacillus hesperidum TaxID=89784 RepID=UPI0007191D94|nr:YlzJ-like family protein [Alicyclobacillus hesperidum]KRW91612.1 hypothetical protein SD51_08180 [Alicyclobacillus tengchongensis]GLG00621.1 hypothetical protein Alches_06600 [Alicyclobacillus hesperidum subsp. aegles]
MHWTTLSDAEIFAGWNEPPQVSYEEAVVGQARLIIARQSNGKAVIERLISPYASDYLRPDWQPGMPFYG